MKYVDLLLRGGARDQIDHILDLALSNDFRRVLRIDQHCVSADRLYPPDALADHGIGFPVLVAAQHRVRPQLPKHQVRMLGGDGVVEASKHVDDALAGNAAVEHHERLGREPARKFDHEPPRIARLDGACARARGG